jgi:drug/metabolite transporter (DMT)-like permease
MIPVFAIVMGIVFLGESISANEIVGAVLIGTALLVIDGQLLHKLVLRNEKLKT